MGSSSEAATFRFVPARCITGGIDRRSRLSRRELVAEYVAPQRPVIVTDAAARWPAMRKFSFEFFRGHYGHLEKCVGGRRYTLGETIDLIESASPESPAPYPFNLNVDTCFPELLRDLQPALSFGMLDRANHPLLPRVLLRGTEIHELFFGGRGAAFPHVHFDALCMHTQITQIVGSKEFFLYPPEQGKYMYPRHDNPKVSQVEFIAPDLQKFPLFAHATPLVVSVMPGETLFFPAGWWHATHLHEPNITFGRVQLNGENWRLYSGDVEAFWKPGHPWFARLARAYLAALGPALKLQERLM